MDNLDSGIWPDMAAVMSMMLRVPMPNPAPHLVEKIKAPILSQVSEIAELDLRWHVRLRFYNASETQR